MELGLVYHLIDKLEAMHKAGYVHRDIQLSNIVKNSYGSVELANSGKSISLSVMAEYKGSIETAS